MQYWLALHIQERSSFTYTKFQRLPTQLRALAGPVVDLLGGATRAEPLRVVVVGCSTGAEPYSISSVLLHTHPSLRVSVEAYDISQEVLDVAKSGQYDSSWVSRNRLMTQRFFDSTFDQTPTGLAVKPAVAERVVFGRCDLLDKEAVDKIRPADVVFAQNILCNMRRSVAKRMFGNIVRLLGERSALFMDGVDLDMRARFTRKHNLRPLDFAVREIHEEALVVRGPRYPHFATGLEPWSERANDPLRRYSTVFLKGL